jgi:hypothetical protein
MDGELEDYNDPNIAFEGCGISVVRVEKLLPLLMIDDLFSRAQESCQSSPAASSWT